MYIDKDQLAGARRALIAQSRDRLPAEKIAFKIRPISERWQILDRAPAYRTATCNVGYIWRDPDVEDRIGRMPPSFAQRRCELRAHGLLLPAAAPLWATDAYRIWQDADSAAAATGNPTEVSAWHMVMQIPATVSPDWWTWLVKGYLQQQLTERGAAVAWAIHALEGPDGWIVPPHAHAVVTAACPCGRHRPPLEDRGRERTTASRVGRYVGSAVPARCRLASPVRYVALDGSMRFSWRSSLALWYSVRQ